MDRIRGKQSYEILGTLDSMEVGLPKNNFVRISGFNIVRIDRIKEFELFPCGDYQITLHSGSKLSLGRRYRG